MLRALCEAWDSTDLSSADVVVPGQDGRSVSLHLTPEGRRRVKRVLENRRQVAEQAFSTLTAAEQSQFSKLVEKMLAGLTRGRQHSNEICRLCDESVCPGATCPVECAVREVEARS